jgi:hypothetical protein
MASTHKWTSVDSAPDALKEGQIVNGADTLIRSKIAEGTVRAGLLVSRGTSDNQVIPLAAIPAADDDAIATLLASAAAAVVYSDTDLDGATGTGPIFPARGVTLKLNSHADWDATVAYVRGLDANGNRVTEEFSIPDAGNATVDGNFGIAFSRVLSVHLPAQSGTNGTCDVGLVSDQSMELSAHDCGVAVYDRMREPSATATVTFDDEETLSVLYSGEIAVITETAVVPGDAVGIRMVESGTDVRGQFAKFPAEDPASLVFAPLLGATFESTTAIDGVAIVRLRG